MAKINWTKKADLLFDKYVFDAYLEYGHLKEFCHIFGVKEFTENIQASYDASIRHSENLRKIVGNEDYCISLTSDTVHIVDIWDSRMNPETLKQRIK